MASDLGAGYIGECTMFYICEMAGMILFDHGSGLMLMKKIVMIAHILGTCSGFGGYAVWRAGSSTVLYQNQ